MGFHERVMATWMYCERRFLSLAWISQIQTSLRTRA